MTQANIGLTNGTGIISYQHRGSVASGACLNCSVYHRWMIFPTTTIHVINSSQWILNNYTKLYLTFSLLSKDHLIRAKGLFLSCNTCQHVYTDQGDLAHTDVIPCFEDRPSLANSPDIISTHQEKQRQYHQWNLTKQEAKQNFSCIHLWNTRRQMMFTY